MGIRPRTWPGRAGRAPGDGRPTSEATATLARRLGIPLVSLDDVASIDVTLDGADEVDARLDLIKGYGGALVREKIVAAASRRLVILVGREKIVPMLGHGAGCRSRSCRSGQDSVGDASRRRATRPWCARTMGLPS